jgi:hypothetical protein
MSYYKQLTLYPASLLIAEAIKELFLRLTSKTLPHIDTVIYYLASAYWLDIWTVANFFHILGDFQMVELEVLDPRWWARAFIKPSASAWISVMGSLHSELPGLPENPGKASEKACVFTRCQDFKDVKPPGEGLWNPCCFPLIFSLQCTQPFSCFSQGSTTQATCPFGHTQLDHVSLACGSNKPWV